MLLKTSVTSFVLLAVAGLHLANAQSRCYNPNRRNGVCTSIYNCPALVSLLQKRPLPPEDRRFLLEGQCNGGVGRQPHVCCNEDTGFITATTSRPQPTSQVVVSPSNGQGNVLPTPPTCGREPTGNRVYSGNNTALDEFPWMILLEYRQKNGQKIVNCGGSLINQRYVLTAAHCVTGAILREVGALATIILGEYDLTKDIDCVDNDCADPVIRAGIEEVKPHENFVDASPSRQHDIALIRLNRDVPYTDFITPICLPSMVNAKASDPGSDLIVAGWGRTLTARQSAIKQKLAIPVWEHDRCVQQFATKNVVIADTQLCAGGRFAQDSCDGDSGGPLMKLNRNYWVLEGIVSFGSRCGLENWPAVYTRVSRYENWIRSNMRS